MVMPAYNEEDNIEEVVCSWKKVLKYGSKDSKIVVSDTGSKDKTHKILLRLKKKIKQLELLDSNNQYHGPKVIALYKNAIDNGADYIFQTDSDGQTNPDEFLAFWRIRKRYDAIFGYRKNRGDGKQRAFVEKVVCFFVKLFFGVRVPDANAPFRLMKSSVMKKYITSIPDDYELPNIILTSYFVRFKEKVCFKEITFRPRVAGVNSINLKRIFKIGLNALVDFCKFKIKMDSIDENKIIGLKKWIAIITFAIVSGSLIIISPSFPWNGGMEMTDSSVFLTVGKQMKNGSIPYTDTFDHKGPILYVINYLAMSINETKGIFLFEFLSVFFTLWFMFKIIRLKYKKTWFAVIMTILLFTPFINLYFSDGGNLVEQYALPFIASSLFFYLKYFLEKGISSASVVGVGIGFACVLMLRINMIGVWIVFSFAVLIECVVRKRIKDLLQFMLKFVSGFLIIVVPILIWLLINNAFLDFIDAYLVFNMEYSKMQSGDIISSILFFLQDIIIVLSLFLSFGFVFCEKNNNDRFLSITYSLAFVTCLFFACISGRTYSHYGMVLVPLTVFPFAMFATSLNSVWKSDAVLGALILFLISLTNSKWLEVAYRGQDSIRNIQQNSETLETIDEICGLMDGESDRSESITVYGNWDYVYLRCGRMPISKYSYQFPIGEVRESIMDEYYDEIEKRRPKFFIIQNIYINDIVLDFLSRNEYREILRDDEKGIRVLVAN